MASLPERNVNPCPESCADGASAGYLVKAFLDVDVRCRCQCA